MRGGRRERREGRAPNGGARPRRPAALAVVAVAVAVAAMVAACQAPAATADQSASGPPSATVTASSVPDAVVAEPAGVAVSDAPEGAPAAWLDEQPPAPDAVEGSYRAVRHLPGASPEIVVFDVVDGRVREAPTTPRAMPTAPAAWRGFAGAEPVMMEERTFDADRSALLARYASEATSTWYREPVGATQFYRGLLRTPAPVFPDGAGGFARAGSTDGLQRWRADVHGADLDFLGWFSPTEGNMNYAPGEATIEVWVDRTGRVRRAVTDHVTEGPETTVFGRFDGLPPIAPPWDARRLPVARVAQGMTVTACGDPAVSQELTRRLDATLGGMPDVRAYRFLDTPTPEQDRVDDTMQTPDDRLFVVAVVLDRRVREPHAANVDVSVTDGERSGYTCSVGSATWIDLDD